MIAAPGRFDALQAIVLAMRMRAPLPEALARLAAEDPALAPWTRAVELPLRQGRPLAEALDGLIDAPCRADLAAGLDAAESLSRCAVRQTGRISRSAWCRHLPTLIALLLGVPQLVVCAVMTVFHVTIIDGVVPLSGSDWSDAASLPGSILAAIGLIALVDFLPDLVPLLLSLGVATVIAGLTAGWDVVDITTLRPDLPLVTIDWIGIAGAAVLLLIALSRIRVLRMLPALWCPEVVRQQALLDLVRAARRQESRVRYVPLALRPFAWMGFWPHRHGQPRWEATWRRWLALTRFRIDTTLRRSLHHVPDLPMRLVMLGVATIEDRQPRWDEAEQLAQQRLGLALRAQQVVVYPLLLLAVAIGILMAAVSLMDPILGEMTVSWHGWLHHSPAQLLALVGIGMGVIIGITILRALARWWSSVTPPAVGQLIARRLEHALRQRQPVDAALDALRPLVPFPYPSRLGVAAAWIRTHPETSIGTVLERARLLPASITPLLTAAQALDHDLLVGLCGRFGMDARLPGRVLRHALPAIVTIVVLIGICGFQIGFVLPKWAMIFRNMGISLSRETIAWMRFGEHPLWVLAGCLILIALAASVTTWWQWRQLRRLMRGQLLLLAADARLPEAAIAAVLAPSLVHPTFATLSRAIGWRADDPPGLARAWRRADARMTRTAVLVGTLIEILGPILLGLLVLSMARMSYGSLIRLLMALGSST